MGATANSYAVDFSLENIQIWWFWCWKTPRKNKHHWRKHLILLLVLTSCNNIILFIRMTNTKCRSFDPLCAVNFPSWVFVSQWNHFKLRELCHFLYTSLYRCDFGTAANRSIFYENLDFFPMLSGWSWLLYWIYCIYFRTVSKCVPIGSKSIQFDPVQLFFYTSIHINVISHLNLASLHHFEPNVFKIHLNSFINFSFRIKSYTSTHLRLVSLLLSNWI